MPLSATTLLIACELARFEESLHWYGGLTALRFGGGLHTIGELIACEQRMLKLAALTINDVHINVKAFSRIMLTISMLLCI